MHKNKTRQHPYFNIAELYSLNQKYNEHTFVSNK